MNNQKSEFTRDEHEEEKNESFERYNNFNTRVAKTDTDGDYNAPTQKSKNLLTILEEQTSIDGTPPRLRDLGLRTKEPENASPPRRSSRRLAQPSNKARSARTRKRARDVENELSSPEQRKRRRTENQPKVHDQGYITLKPPQPKRRQDVKATLSVVSGLMYTLLRDKHRLLCVEKDNEHYIVNHDGTLTPYKKIVGDTGRISQPFDTTYSEYSTSLAALKDLDIVGYIKIHGDYQVAVNTRNGIRYINRNGELLEPDGKFQVIDSKPKLFDLVKNLSNRNEILRRILRNWEAYNKREGNVNIPLFEIKIQGNVVPNTE